MLLSQSALADKARVGGIRSIVGGPLFMCQVYAHTLGSIGGKLLSNKRLESLGVDNWPYQLIESPALTNLLVLFGIRGCQAKAEGCRCHERCFSPRFGR